MCCICTPDDDLLKAPEIPVQVLIEEAQVDDGVGHELARTMVCYLTTSEKNKA